MKGDTPLDYAVFQLTPTRTRCELMVSAGGETEKLASGLLNPFLMHIKAVNDQIVKGGCSIKLEPPGDDAAQWFTKGTIERFVRFVSTPEVLERVCSVDNELSHLEESLSRNSDTYLCDEQTAVSGMSSPSSGTDGSRQSEFGNLQVPAGEHESPRLQLLKALEARRFMLQKEQSMAFARAIAAGFVAENIPSLIQFADYFGASRLHDACENYMRLCAKRRESEIWLEDTDLHSLRQADIEAQANGTTREAQVVSLCGEGELGLPYDSSCSGNQLREDRLVSLEPESNKIGCGESVAGGGNIDQRETYTEDISGRRLSVQEKITMFESKKKTAGGIYDKRRMSTDAGRMDSEKPVLRRWSLAVDKTATSSQQEGNLKNLEPGEEVEQRAEDAHDDPQADASGVDLLLPGGNKDVNKEKIPAQASSSINYTKSQSTSISLDNFWGQRGQYEQSGEKQVQEDQNSVMSDTQSLKETKGRLYDKYREKRDAKLREEPGAKKAEKQARLKAMQETLERRRAEVARSLRSNKADVLAEARQRAEKLRAFKAGLLEIKRAQEEEEKKRLEELRMQRLQKKPACAPASPCSGASTLKQSGVRSSMLPTFQRATSTVRTIQKNPVSQSVPSTSEFRRMSGKPRRTAQQDNGDAAAKPRASSSNKEESQRLRSMVLRKSVDALRGLQKGQPVSIPADTLAVNNNGGLKCLSSDSDPQEGLTTPAAESVATEAADGNRVEDLKDMVIRAPVTSDEELARPIENDAEEQDQVAARVVAVPAENEYKAPIAPVSISPMVEAYGA